MHRYLFGPVTAQFAHQNLNRQRAAGECLAFNADGTADLKIASGDSWESVQTRLPRGFEPNYVVLNLPYSSIPNCLWSAPVPTIGLALDWHLLWHFYRKSLPYCDLVLSDQPGNRLMQKQGIANVRLAKLCGVERDFLECSRTNLNRDIDILFVGNFNPSIHPNRMPLLAKLSKFSERYRVLFRTGIFGDSYLQLLKRTRILVNHSSRGRCSRRVLEAASQGALVFQHGENQELTEFFNEGAEYIESSDDTIESLLERFLNNEEDRAAVAKFAQSRVLDYSFENLWDDAVKQVNDEWTEIAARRSQRSAMTGEKFLLARGLQALSAPPRSDSGLLNDLERATRDYPDSASLLNAHALALGRLATAPAAIPAMAEVAVRHLQSALERQPANVMAGLNLAESLAACGKQQQASECVRRALAVLEGTAADECNWLEDAHFEPGFGPFRVEWERAAWSNAGNSAEEKKAKQKLIRWQLHFLRAGLNKQLTDYYEAITAYPSVAMSQSALGCTLASGNQPIEALPHLRSAVAKNPFDREALLAHFHSLRSAFAGSEIHSLIRNRRLLSQSCPQLAPAEAWFAEPPPSATDLASLIILCCNQLEFTKQCLESVIKHTKQPFELVIVDNGSTDGTAEYLAEIETHPGPNRVKIIRNEENLGYAAGCNQGLSQAIGQYIVFLNNDVIVTPEWLNRLIRWSLHQWPQIGIVGAVTNYAPPPQGIRPDYQSLDDLDTFAEKRGREFGERFLEVQRATGFCLLARRDVLDRIGGFDESYGLGFFDDDDLCIRSREAGFRLVVALDAYVHHFGSRTFHGLGIDTKEQLQTNFQLFKDKWGKEHTAGYKPPPDSADERLVVAAEGEPATVEWAGSEGASTSGARPHVSLCMIVKNEETQLPDCLASCADLFDEIIVVDTGSTDKTKEVAARFGVRLFDFEWVDSFGVARNECLKQATGKWIVWLDADDRLDEANRAKMRSFLNSLGDERDAYAMKVRSVLDNQGSAFRILDQVRVFPNHPEIRWEYRVHEQILPSVRRLGGANRWADVVVDHIGYQDESMRRQKLERNLRLLELDDRDRPDDAFTLFNLGWTSMDLGRADKALPMLQRSLQRSAPDSSIVRKLYALLVQAHRQLGQIDEALEVCNQGVDRFPDDTELLHEKGLMHWQRRDLTEAEFAFLTLVESKPGQYFASVDDGARGYRTRNMLGDFYREQERLSEAELQWRSVLAERPRFLPAWRGLANLFLDQQRWSDLDRAIEALESESKDLDASVLRARGCLARKEFVSTRQILNRVIDRHPQEIEPRVLLTYVLLQEGRDPAATENALRSVLRLDPCHAETRHNLKVFLNQNGRTDEASQVDAQALGLLYEQTCTTPSDINEHCKTLHDLAKHCSHITELGTRTGVSTTALLYAKPKRLVCYDKLKQPQIDRLMTLAGDTEFVFRQEDVLQAEIEETDLLFIDTWHVYDQIREELRLHTPKTRKYVVLHDTTTYAEVGESPEHIGLWPAVEEFLADSPFSLKKRYGNNNGLAILERV